MTIEDVDFVVALWREEGRWVAVPLPPHAADTLESLSHALRQQPGEGGVIGMVSLDRDVAMILRVTGDHSRAVISDIAAADDYDLAADLAEAIDLLDDDEAGVAGDTALLADLGVPADHLEMLLDDEELYPDEVLQAVADRLGCPAEFQTARRDPIA
jgi:putative tRNA adenosine deaminase-associated protein